MWYCLSNWESRAYFCTCLTIKPLGQYMEKKRRGLILVQQICLLGFLRIRLLFNWICLKKFSLRSVFLCFPLSFPLFTKGLGKISLPQVFGTKLWSNTTSFFVGIPVTGGLAHPWRASSTAVVIYWNLLSLFPTFQCYWSLKYICWRLLLFVLSHGSKPGYLFSGFLGNFADIPAFFFFFD